MQLILKIALLRSNLHTVQFTHLKCPIRWFLAYLQSCVTITNFHTRPSCREKPCAHLQSLPISKPSHRQPTTHLCHFFFFLNIKGNVSCECIHFKESLPKYKLLLLTSQLLLSPLLSAVIFAVSPNGRATGWVDPKGRVFICSG